MSSEGPGRLFLIDGYALIYRAFFAMISRPLRTSRGENTSAVWGVANFLHRLTDEHHPELVAWVHDAGSSFRTDVFPDYKATREKLDDELQEDFDRSLARIEDLLECFGVPLVEVDGYEADDVIGTLAAQGAEAGYQAVIVSGDKDFYQLIGPRVALLNPGRRGPAAVDEQWVDLSNAHERLGVAPHQVVDFLALVGDASDNVPGVRGVGEKTARMLLTAYGDLDSVLAHAAEVKGKRAREALLDQAENARLSRELVTLRRDVPVRVALADLAARPADLERLQRLYSELEFHSLVQQIDARPRATAPPAAACVIVRPGDDIPSIVETLRTGGLVAVGVAATTTDPMSADLVGLVLALADGRAWYFPFGHVAPEGELVETMPVHNLPGLDGAELRPLVGLLTDPAVRKTGHNIKDDWLVLRRHGVELAGVEDDLILASFLLDPGRRSHALAASALEHLGVRLTVPSDLIEKGASGRSVAHVSMERVAECLGTGAVTMHELRSFFAPQLAAHALTALLSEIEVPLIGVLVDMESRGIAIDGQRLASLSGQFGDELARLQREIFSEAGSEFNINSTAQLRHILFEKLNLPVLKKTKTGPSTDASVLAELADTGFALPRLLLEYREVSKLQSTYVDVLPQWVSPQTGRIHTRFSQTGAATGRLASFDPNLQNIPVRTARGEEIRRCFVPATGRRFVVADYSQIELRLLAHLSQDSAFLEAFQRGGDVHRETAAVIFDVEVEAVTSEMRAQAKTINFATIYGQGAFSLSRQLGIDQDEARAFIDLYFERFAGVRAYLDGCIERAKDLGYAETLFGRRRYIPELKDRTYNVRAFGERVAMNSPLQGSAADLIKQAMISVWVALHAAGLESALLLQVHDELVVEAPNAEVDEASGILRQQMEGAATLAVPLVVDVGVGDNWLDAKH
jgi:DNA polymerase-1